MKTNAIVRIVVFSLAILMLLGILVAVLAFNMYIVNGRVYFENEELVEEPVEMINTKNVTAQVKNIEIEWAAGSITIQPDDSVSDITIQEFCRADSKYQMVYRQSGQTLEIQFCEDSIKFPSFGVNADVSKDLVITVPADWICNSLEIDAAAAEVEIHDLQINELDFDGASGKFILDNCDIVKLDIDTASGDVEYKGILKELDFVGASACFRGEFMQMPNHLYLDTMSGDLDIILPEYCWFTCELDTMSGSFDSDFETKTENGVYVHGNSENACHIKVSAMSGDVNIRKGVAVPQTNN